MAKKIVTPEMLDTFRRSLQDGDTLFFILHHVSKSGMARFFNVYAFPVRNGKSSPYRLTWSTAEALGYTYDKRSESLRVNGYGFCAEDEITRDLGELLGMKLEYRRIG